MSTYSLFIFGNPNGFEAFEFNQNNYSRIIGTQIEPFISAIKNNSILCHLHNENGISYLKIYTSARGRNNFRPGGLIGVGLMSKLGILKISDKNITVLINILNNLRKYATDNGEINLTSFKEFDPTKLGFKFEFLPEYIEKTSNVSTQNNSSILIAKSLFDISNKNTAIEKLSLGKHFFVLDDLDVLYSELNNSHKGRFKDSIYMLSNNGIEVMPYAEKKDKPAFTNQTNKLNQTTEIESKNKTNFSGLPQERIDSLQSKINSLNKQLNDEKQKYLKLIKRKRKQQILLLLVISFINIIFLYSLFQKNNISIKEEKESKSSGSTKEQIKKNINQSYKIISINTDSIAKYPKLLEEFSLWYINVLDSTTVKKNSNIYPTKNPVIEFDLLKAHRLGIDTNLLKTKINK